MASSDQTFTKLPMPAKAGIGVGILVLIGLVYYFALHMKMNEEIQGARQHHASLVDDLHDAEARNAEFVQLSEQLAAREGLDRANLRALPADAEMPAFLRDLNRYAELSGLRMQLVEPRPEEPSEQYVRLPVNLELKGRYHQLARFFNNVSRLDRLISMENIHLRNPQAEGEDVVLDVTVLATTFRRPGDPAAEQAAGGAQ